MFSILKKRHSFKESNDNWNPADIWIVNTSKESQILTELDSTNSVIDFNVKMKEYFENRWLVGVSLKKVSGKVTPKLIDASKIKPFN